MRKNLCLCFILIIGLTNSAFASKLFGHKTQLVAAPKQSLLTEGLSEWTKTGGKQPAGSGWELVDGKLHRKSGSGDIVSKEQYQNFILDFSWTIQKGGNSGIKYRLMQYPKTEGSDISGWLGLEFQVLDDFNTNEGKNPRTATASLYHVLPAKENKPLLSNEQINRGRIVVIGNRIEHWLNGQRVTCVYVGSKEWNEGVAAGKFKNVPEFAQNKLGHILVQDHGNEVTFHSMTVQKLSYQKKQKTLMRLLHKLK